MKAPDNDDQSLPRLDLSLEEIAILRDLKVPVPDDEVYRLNILRETKLLDSDQSDPDFDRYTSLAKRIFNVRFMDFVLFNFLKNIYMFSSLTYLRVVYI